MKLPQKERPASTEVNVHIDGLSHRFASREVLHDITMDIPSGKIVGLLGPSGSGKTTLIRCIVGLLTPSYGKVECAGIPLPSALLAPILGYMAQFDSLYEDLTGMQNLEFFAALYGLRGRSARPNITRVLGLTELEADEKKQVKNYSGGMKKRLSLAIALLHNPELLVLDEPTVGIDPVLRAQFWEEFRRLKKRGHTIILSTHVMDEAERCDVLAMIFEGRLLAYASPEAIMVQTGTKSVEDAFLSLRKESVMK